MINRSVFFSILSAFAMVLGGCSLSKEFTKTASPLTTVISNRVEAYANAESDPIVKSATAQKIAIWRSNVAAGDIDGTNASWYGVPTPPGVRDIYLSYVTSDAKYKTPEGAKVLGIFMNDVALYDYVLATAKSKSAPVNR